MDREYSHIDSYFALLRQKKIGRPVALTYDAAFMAIFSALRDRRDDPDNRLLHYCLSKYGRDVSDKSIERINDALEDLYKGVYNKKENWQEKKRLLDEICDNFNRLSPCEKLAEEMMGFGKSLKEQTGKKGMPGEKKQATADHLKYFATACGKKLSSAVSLLPQGRMSKEAVLFCLTNGLPTPAQTPTTDELEKSLFADNINEKMDAAEYLAAMGAGAAGSEEKVVKCLRRAEHMNVSGTTNLQWTLVSVLGNIRARSPEALEMLMSMLEKGDYVVPDSAMAALGRIGRPALPLLHSAYDSKEDFVKIRIVKTIVLMGKDARSETAFLKSQAAKAQNADLKDVLNDALEDIQREK
jgi:hypothetical protein